MKKHAFIFAGMIVAMLAMLAMLLGSSDEPSTDAQSPTAEVNPSYQYDVLPGIQRTGADAADTFNPVSLELTTGWPLFWRSALFLNLPCQRLWNCPEICPERKYESGICMENGTNKHGMWERPDQQTRTTMVEIAPLPVPTFIKRQYSVLRAI